MPVAGEIPDFAPRQSDPHNAVAGITVLHRVPEDERVRAVAADKHTLPLTGGGADGQRELQVRDVGHRDALVEPDRDLDRLAPRVGLAVVRAGALLEVKQIGGHAIHDLLR